MGDIARFWASFFSADRWVMNSRQKVKKASLCYLHADRFPGEMAEIWF